MNPVVIIEFPSNLGLKEPSPGHEPGVRKLPAWLKQHGFYDRINAVSVFSLEAPAYSMSYDAESGVRNAASIGSYAMKQAQLLNEVLDRNVFPIAIGGDCSILIGVALGLKQRGKFGLFYLDGHHDYMLPELSGTGGAAGMDLAIVTGHGHEKLTDLSGARPYLKEENTWCVGNREYDPAYVDPILASAIHYVDLPALRKTGTGKCVEDFLKMVTVNQLDGFWIHLDVDVLNNDIMPAVDSPEPGGLTYKELDELLSVLLKDERATGIEITILDPELDPKGNYTAEFVNQFCNTLRSSRGNSKPDQ